MQDKKEAFVLVGRFLTEKHKLWSNAKRPCITVEAKGGGGNT